MKAKAFFCCLSGFLIAAGPLPASGVELRAEMDSGPTGKTEVTVYVQDNNLRADLPGTSMLMNMESGAVTTVMHEQKMFMQLPTDGLAQFATLAKPAQETAASGDPDCTEAAEVKFEPTGRKETISGFLCEEYKVPAQPGLTIWFTREAPVQQGVLDRLAGLAGVRKSIPFDLGDLSGLPGFPIRVILKTPVDEFQMTVLSLTQKSFMDSDFQPPAGYQSFSLPPEMGEMLKQLQQQGGLILPGAQ